MWDCHVHPFGEAAKYPPAQNRAYEPPVEDMRGYYEEAAQAAIGRHVYVQASIYGLDNSLIMDRLDDDPVGRRAVIAPPRDGDLMRLRKLHERGVRGVRLNMQSPGAAGVREFWLLEPYLKELGWHVAAFFDATKDDVFLSVLSKLSVPLVLDHFGFPPRNAVNPDLPCFTPILRAMEVGKAYVKFSAPYQISSDNMPYSDLQKLGSRYVATNENQILYGTNWPHVGQAYAPPAMGKLVSSMAMVGSVGVEKFCRITSQNAERLYA